MARAPILRSVRLSILLCNRLVLLSVEVDLALLGRLVLLLAQVDLDLPDRVASLSAALEVLLVLVALAERAKARAERAEAKGAALFGTVLLLDLPRLWAWPSCALRFQPRQVMPEPVSVSSLRLARLVQATSLPPVLSAAARLAHLVRLAPQGAL